MKKQKIIITGGLGYIGTELCKLYSGETRYNDIIVIDNRFVSERVKQLRDWGFVFIQADILNKEKMSEICGDADIIHHLAGITDVAYVKTQETPEKDKLIIDTAIQGTSNILNAISNTCKLIFPSTHVIFEGFSETKFDISEDEVPCPVLTYAKCKAENEKEIKSSGKNYVIFRLGSVYGYSTDTMRIGIMPNLFSKMASQNNDIKLFSGGVQYKSLSPLVDVARCFKFMAEKPIVNEIFHLTKENITVKEVAELCQKYNPEIKLISTTDEIPNLGYTLSNKKLINAGFNFLGELDGSIKEMIVNWSKKEQAPELEFILNGQNEYIDSRGRISNYELTEPINLIGYIESVAGSVRANHYHPIQEQKCLLIKGRYVSVIKDLGVPNAIVQTRLINPGDIAVIQPNVAHTMVFLEDSIFLNLVRGERDHDKYGVTHTIPYILVDEAFRQNIINNYTTKCRATQSTTIEPILSLGLSPLANNLLDSPDDQTELFPLELTYVPDSCNCQLSYVVPANKMFDTYLYTSSTTKSFREHFERAAELYIKEFNLNQDSLVVDIGSNDGIALRPLLERGIKIVGIEPAVNIAEVANKNGITTYNSYFTEEVVDEIIKTYGNADLVTASNVFAHSDKLKEMAMNVSVLLKKTGTFIIEVQYLMDTIKDLTFDNIYHEHVNYWSVTSLDVFCKSIDLCIAKVVHIDTHGGSIRVYIKKSGEEIDGSVNTFLESERKFGLNSITTFKKFAEDVYTAKNNVIKHIKTLKDRGLTLVGYGAPAKATTSLNFYGITSKELDYIIEDNKLKHGKFIPGVKIPIHSKEKLKEALPDVIIVMAWNFFEEIKKNNQELIDAGVKFINIKELQYDNPVL